MTDILCLSAADLEELLPLPDAIEAVRDAFVLHASGEGHLFSLVRERLAADAMFGIKSGWIPSRGVLGLKAGGSWKANKTRGDEAHQATILLLDPASGKPLAFLDGNHITTVRTGAAGGVGADLFADPEATTLAVIGTGVQGRIQTEAVLHVRPSVERVQCFNPNGPVRDEYTGAFEGRIELVVCESVSEATEGAKIVVTATPSTEALVFTPDLAPGCHVNAVGSDTLGKRELDPAVLDAAQVFVDDTGQSRSIGELQGLEQVEATPIGDVLSGAAPGRTTPDGITVFDSTGISLQDLTSAWRAYHAARERGVGSRLRW